MLHSRPTGAGKEAHFARQKNVLEKMLFRFRIVAQIPLTGFSLSSVIDSGMVDGGNLDYLALMAICGRFGLAHPQGEGSYLSTYVAGSWPDSIATRHDFPLPCPAKLASGYELQPTTTKLTD